MYSKMAQRRALIQQANYWIKAAARPDWEKAITGIPGIFFRAKVRFHGSVGMITHAGINIFNPTEWGTYWPNFVKQFQMMGWFDKGAYHERAMQDLVRDPNYITARRAGLANDATHGRDDYERAFSTGSKLFQEVDNGVDVDSTRSRFTDRRVFTQEWEAAPTP